jgi:hypothetical protein
MRTEFSAKPSEFAPVEGRPVVAEFDGGTVTSDAGGLLLGAADKAIGLVLAWPAAFATRVTADISNTGWPRWSGSAYSALRWDMRKRGPHYLRRTARRGFRRKFARHEA